MTIRANLLVQSSVQKLPPFYMVNQDSIAGIRGLRGALLGM